MRHSTATIALFICAGLLVAQASFFDRLWENTKLRGKFNVNTTKGLKVNYDATLGYKDEKFGVDLVNLGLALNATPDTNLSADGLQGLRYVNYTAAVTANGGGHTVNVSANGTAGVITALNQTKLGNNSDAFLNFFHVNNWFLQGGEAGAQGNHEARLKLWLDAVKNGRVIHLHELAEGYVNTNGDVFGEKPSNFTWQKDGIAHVHKNIAFPRRSEDLEGKPRPAAVYNGRAEFKGREVFGWNDNTTEVLRKGIAGFAGAAFAGEHNGTNGTHVHGLTVDQDTNYKYVSQFRRNGEVVGHGFTEGKVDEIKNFGYAHKDNQYEAVATSVGTLGEVDLVRLNTTNGTQDHTVAYNAQWNHVTGARNDGDNVIRFGTKTLYQAGGKADGKPFQYETNTNHTGTIDLNKQTMEFN